MTRFSRRDRNCLHRKFLAIFTMVLSLGALCTAQETAPTLRQPILITSAGQGADSTVLNALLRRAQVAATVDEQATEAHLDGISTLLITLGGSQKALGAAGISVGAELSRIEALLASAEERGVVVVGVHIGGEGRRGPLSDPFIQAVAPRSQLLIVTNDGNKDGYFTTIAADGDIPLRLLDRVNEVAEALTALLAEE